MKDVDATETVRVSVATYNQVLFPDPENGTIMLALERKAKVLDDGTVSVLAQPFGGGVRILDPTSLREIIGEIQFDSKSSKRDQDFRVLIPMSKWETVKQYCLRHLENPADSELEAAPDRELVEEFEETIHYPLSQEQYKIEPLGFVIEDNPVQTMNWYARGYLTVRVYRIYKVQIVDPALSEFMLTTSQENSDQDLKNLASKDLRDEGRGKANSILVLPFTKIVDAFRALPPDMRYRKTMVEDHKLDESVLAVLGEVDVPQYQRI